MRIFLVTAIAAIAAFGSIPRAQAEDVEALKAQYSDLRGGCRLGEIGDKTLSEAESEKACEDLEAVGKKLQEANLCWDNSELVWDKCPLTN